MKVKSDLDDLNGLLDVNGAQQSSALIGHQTVQVVKVGFNFHIWGHDL